METEKANTEPADNNQGEKVPEVKVVALKIINKTDVGANRTRK